jgi:hypothetical protein
VGAESAMTVSGAEAMAGATSLEDNRVPRKANARRASPDRRPKRSAAKRRSRHAAAASVMNVQSGPIVPSGRSAANGLNVVSGLSEPSAREPKQTPSSKAKAAGVAGAAGAIAAVAAQTAKLAATSPDAKRDWTPRARNP